MIAYLTVQLTRVETDTFWVTEEEKSSLRNKDDLRKYF